MWEFVDKVVYINLEHRTDRREQMERMTSKFGADKVIRFPAIQHSKGYIGCSKSHGMVLKMAIENGWNNVLILEDDAEWNDYDSGYEKLLKITQSDYDVVMLGGTWVEHDPSSFRLRYGQTCTGYLVNKNYMSTLLANFEESLANLIRINEQREFILKTCNFTTNIIDNFKDNDSLYRLDVHWKHLQPRDKWFVVMPPLVYQTPSYSDIEGTDVDYSDYFGVKKPST